MNCGFGDNTVLVLTHSHSKHLLWGEMLMTGRLCIELSVLSAEFCCEPKLL
jgi:hypothetical protein